MDITGPITTAPNFQSPPLASTLTENSRSSEPTERASSPQAKRKRVVLNCEECRRNKTKCDRTWPCANCVDRGLAHLCPNGALKHDPPKSQTIARLEARVAELERQLLAASSREQSWGKTHKVSPSSHGSSNPDGDDLHIFDTTALLGSLTAPGAADSRTRRPAVLEGSSFYLSSNENSDDEVSGTSPSAAHDRAETNRDHDMSLQPFLNIPWTRRRGLSAASTSTTLMHRCRQLLPRRHVAMEIFDQYWAMSSWRIQPITRNRFVTRLIPGIYDSPDGAHLHDLAALFAIIAFSQVFDDSLPAGHKWTSPVAKSLVHEPGPRLKVSLQPETRHVSDPYDYLEAAYACLVAGNFLTDTTISSLIALYLMIQFNINSGEKKAADAVFPIAGLAMRLATIGGYHREPTAEHLSLDERNDRRRIWYELHGLERVHCLFSMTPDSMRSSCLDVKYPTDVPVNDYFWWKWTLGKHMAEVVEYWSVTHRPPESALLQIDSSVRQIFYSLPPHLRCASMAGSSYPFSKEEFALPNLPEESGLSTASLSSTMYEYGSFGQQARLSKHICMILFTLHRPLFIRFISSSRTHDAVPFSVQTIIETNKHIIDIATAVADRGLSSNQWSSYAADLFAILHCQTAYILTGASTFGPPQPGELTPLQELERGTTVLQRLATSRPSAKNKAMVRGAAKMLGRARLTVSLTTRNTTSNLGYCNFQTASTSWSFNVDDSLGVSQPTEPGTSTRQGHGVESREQPAAHLSQLSSQGLAGDAYDGAMHTQWLDDIFGLPAVDAPEAEAEDIGRTVETLWQREAAEYTSVPLDPLAFLFSETSGR